VKVFGLSREGEEKSWNEFVGVDNTDTSCVGGVSHGCTNNTEKGPRIHEQFVYKMISAISRSYE